MTATSSKRGASTTRPVVAANDTDQPMSSPVFWLSAGLLVVAFVFGGASRNNPISTMAIEVFGLALLVATFWARAAAGDWRMDWPGTTLAGVVLALPALQLVPLPPEIWTALPGRDMAVETLRIAGIEPGWSPLSLDPEATFRALLWLIPPLALFLAVSGLDARSRYWLTGVVLALCIISLVLGGLQIAGREGGFLASPGEGEARLPIGFFANRNHQGVAMAVALPFAAAFTAIWGSESHHRTRAATIIFAAFAALLLVGTLVTRSRAGLTLAGPSLIASIGLFWTATGGSRLRLGAVLMLAAAVVTFLFAAQIAISFVLDRFESLVEGDARFDMWRPTIKAGADAAPFGTGLGTFDPIYRAVEPLGLMGEKFVNHAHNEYLELWLELGMPAPLALIALFLWLGRATLTAWSRSTSRATVLARAGGIAVPVLLVHSAVDYPLRTQALACVVAFAAGCLLVSQQGVRRDT